MKKIIAILSIILSASVISAYADTSSNSIATASSTPPASFYGGLKEMGNAIATATNWTSVAGYGHGLSGGGNNLAFGGIAYNFTENVGAYVGYDYLWNSSSNSFNSIRGGITLQDTIKPLTFIGQSWTTNVTATPYAAVFLATPRNGNAVGEVNAVGANIDVYAVKNFELIVGGGYENRVGQGSFDGNYAYFNIGLSRRF